MVFPSGVTHRRSSMDDATKGPRHSALSYWRLASFKQGVRLVCRNIGSYGTWVDIRRGLITFSKLGQQWRP